jgi:hypothetical protein
MLANKWLTQKTDFWCARPPAAANMSVSAWLELSAPFNEKGQYDNCSRFVLDDVLTLPSTRPRPDMPVEPCQHWEYDTSEFQVRQSIFLVHQFCGHTF